MLKVLTRVALSSMKPSTSRYLYGSHQLIGIQIQWCSSSSVKDSPTASKSHIKSQDKLNVEESVATKLSHPPTRPKSALQQFIDDNSTIGWQYMAAWHKLQYEEKLKYMKKYAVEMEIYYAKVRKWYKKICEQGGQELLLSAERSEVAESLGKPPVNPKGFARFMQDYCEKHQILYGHSAAAVDAWQNLTTEEKAKYFCDESEEEQQARLEREYIWKNHMIAEGHRVLIYLKPSDDPRKESRSIQHKVGLKFGKPKRPLNAKARFSLEFRENCPDDVKHMKNAWKTGKEAWEALSEEEKLKYFKQYEQELSIYEEQMDAWEEKMICEGYDDLFTAEHARQLAVVGNINKYVLQLSPCPEQVVLFLSSTASNTRLDRLKVETARP
uniref:HMG box domain-containing protein n=1 Tax=Plectus sambesii TaxID=2011161 RepID=A0A914VDL9_9BILA